MTFKQLPVGTFFTFEHALKNSDKNGIPVYRKIRVSERLVHGETGVNRELLDHVEVLKEGVIIKIEDIDRDAPVILLNL